MSRAALALAAIAATVATVGAPAPAQASPRPALPAAPVAASVVRTVVDSPAPPDDGSRIWAVRPAGPTGKPDNRLHFVMQSPPGGTITDRILVTNRSKVTVPFAVYATDAFNQPNGAFDLLSANRKPADIGTWIRFPSPVVTIPAGQTVLVPFTVSVPASATPGDHAGGVVVSLADLNGKPGVNIDSRVAVRVYLRIPGNLRPHLDVDATGSYHGVTNPFGYGSMTVRYTVSNPGNIRLRSHQTITVKSPFGNVLGRLTAADLPEILPGQHATFSVTFKHIFPAGPLTVTVALTPFPDPQQPLGPKVPGVSHDAYAWAIPWLLVLFVLVILGALAGLWWWRRRRVLARLDAAMTVARDETLGQQRSPAAAGASGAGKS
jgi:WxL interacting protein linking bacterial and host surfaces